MSNHLTPPHGDELVDLLASDERREELKEGSRDWPSWDLTERQLCDLELLLSGAFSPLQGFMSQAVCESVCSRMRLENGLLWPLPILLDVPEELAGTLSKGDPLVLRDPEGVMLAVLHVEDAWALDLPREADAVFGTADRAHPGVDRLFRLRSSWAVGGRLEGVQPPVHYDFVTLRHTPAELRKRFSRAGWRRIVAFQTRSPLYRAQVAMTLRASSEIPANLLLHPVVGRPAPGDVDHFTRVRCYQAVLDRFPQHTVTLSLLPLAMRLAGPREALLHAIIRKNYGCSHFIVGSDHAGPGCGPEGRPFYEPYAAQELLKANEEELGINMVPFRKMAYAAPLGTYLPENEVPEGTPTWSLSEAELQDRLATGRGVPEWFTFPEVAEELHRTYPERHKRGFTVFLTGLSGAGKSTIANVLRVRFLEMGGRPVTLLDGDIVRRHLSSELGFSREHRDVNIRRIGFVASEITKNGGIAICAPIAPYEEVRREVREMVESGGGFTLVHVSTPLVVCETRDRKGLYAKARAGIIPGFTGVSDPYEVPSDADVVIDTSDRTPEEAAQQVILHLEREGYIGPAAKR